MTVNPEVVKDISALWSRRAASVLVNNASAVPIGGDSTSLIGRTLLIWFGSNLPAPTPVTVWIDPGTIAPWVFTGGAGVHWVMEKVPPERPVIGTVMQVGGAGIKPEPIVVRNAVLFTKTKPEDASIPASRALSGTRDEFSKVLPTRYWPSFDAA